MPQPSHLRQDSWSCPSSALEEEEEKEEEEEEEEEEEPAQAAFSIALKEGCGPGQVGFDSKAETLQSLEAKVPQWRLVPGRVTAAG